MYVHIHIAYLLIDLYDITYIEKPQYKQYIQYFDEAVLAKMLPLRLLLTKFHFVIGRL